MGKKTTVKDTIIALLECDMDAEVFFRNKEGEVVSGNLYCGERQEKLRSLY